MSPLQHAATVHTVHSHMRECVMLVPGFGGGFGCVASAGGGGATQAAGNTKSTNSVSESTRNTS